MAVRELGPERVVYGSDVGGRSFASQLAKVMGADIPDSAKELVLGGNLRRLFAPALASQRVPGVIIDTNVNLSRWPFRRLPGDETPDLVARLRHRNVVQAWAGSFDGILHKDIGGVNARLAAECNTYGKGFLVPFGSINPKLPDWQEDVRRCAQDYRMPGIRLHPNYHGYELKDPVFAELLHVAAASGLMVQLVVSMEDIRTQHPLMRVPPVDLSALAQVVKEPALDPVDPAELVAGAERTADQAAGGCRGAIF